MSVVSGCPEKGGSSRRYSTIKDMTFTALKLFFTDMFLVKKFIAVAIGLLLFRVLASVPVPQIDAATLGALLYQNQLLGVFNIFSGGGLSNFSIAMLGVFPYITVAIIVQLLTVVSPRIHSMYHEEGEIGRKKIGQWTRVATVPVAIINAIGILAYFQSQQVIPQLPIPDFTMSVLFIVAGSMLTMWVGELITEFGIGNGISFIVFAGIVVNIPTLMTQAVATFSPALAPMYIIAGIGIIVGVMLAVWMNEADRPVPITYARYGIGHGSGDRRVETYIPVKVNPVGVLSIIFALVVTAFFQYLFKFMGDSATAAISTIGTWATEVLANGYYYAIPVALLTFFFTYFHAPIVFNVKKIADNIQQQGAFIPGVRPGEDTVEYFSKVLKRVVCYAAVFLTAIAAVPFLVTGSSAGTFLFAVGGTGALIIVSVILDVYRKTGARINDLKALL